MLTKQEIAEFAKCKTNVEYFIENYCLIQHPIQGLVPFKLYDFQKDILKSFYQHRFNISNKSRQVGMSTITASYALWLALFHKKRSIIIISIKDEDAKEFLKKIKTAYYHLPKWMQGTVVQDNVHTLELDSGSVITSVASGSSAARGRTPSLLIIDEAAFIEQLEEIWTSAWPTLSKGGSAILVSTPNGVGGTFYDLWQNADADTPNDKRNTFNRIFVHWTQIPEYRDYIDIEGKSFGQIVEEAKQGKWFKSMRPQFDDRKWAQEFEGDFLGSGNTVVNPSVLKVTKDQMEPPIKKLTSDFLEHENGELWIWVEPQPNRLYLLGADVATGDGTDYSTTEVLDLLSGEQVAEFQGRIDIPAYAKFLAKLGAYYNTGMLIPEATGLGIGLVQKLVYEIGYENMFQFQNEFTMKKKKRTYGWLTSPKTRPLLIQAIQTYFNSGNFKWRSRRLWKEAAAFVWKDTGKPEAEVGNNDDLMFALALAAQNRMSAMYTMPVGMNQTFEELGQITGNLQDNDKTVEPVREPFGIVRGNEEDLDDINWLRS